jgi:hypothetical protein
MTNEGQRTIPLPPEFLLEVPLYKSFPFDPTGDDYKSVGMLKYFTGNIDCYCIGCRKESVFQALRQSNYDAFMAEVVSEERAELTADHIISIELFCTRNTTHRLHYIFRIENNNITKIGQSPSMADLSSIELQKYRKILSVELFAEFNRAIGLISHGVGIGAFVYLRRIFESLILKAHGRTESKTDWDEGVYQGSRMDEKINLLKDFLPPFMVEHKSLYSILSKGIHDLSEEECLAAFPIVKAGIEMILDEEISEHERKVKETETRKAISKLKGEIKGS